MAKRKTSQQLIIMSPMGNSNILKSMSGFYNFP